MCPNKSFCQEVLPWPWTRVMEVGVGCWVPLSASGWEHDSHLPSDGQAGEGLSPLSHGRDGGRLPPLPCFFLFPECKTLSNFMGKCNSLWLTGAQTANSQTIISIYFPLGSTLWRYVWRNRVNPSITFRARGLATGRNIRAKVLVVNSTLKNRVFLDLSPHPQADFSTLLLLHHWTLSMPALLRWNCHLCTLKACHRAS